MAEKKKDSEELRESNQHKECKDIFKAVERYIKKQPGYGVEMSLLKAAYAKAEYLHGETLRESGELYLKHPLAAMESLSHLSCETSVLAAALLHDTMEDCGYTFEALREDFTPKIAEIVSAVTAIKKIEKSVEEDFENLSEQEKHDILDQLTDAKLIKSKYQREAFLVRLADREHNLSTIEAVSTEKRRMKIEQTETFLIPAAERLGMRYYEIVLKDYCLKFKENNYEIEAIRSFRNDCLSVSGPAFSRFDTILQEGIEKQEFFSFPPFNPFARLRGNKKNPGTEDLQIEKRRVLRPYEILCQLKDGIDYTRRDVCLTEVILTSVERDKATILKRFIAFYREHLQPHDIFFEIDEEGENSITVKLSDVYDNNFRVVIIPRSDLKKYFIGDPDNGLEPPMDDRSLGDALRPKMTVYAYSAYKGLKAFEQRVPRGATALDFAFMVSEAMALTVESAQIHEMTGEKVSFTEDDYPYPLKTILNDGDVVHFVTNYTPHSHQIVNQAKMDWFSYINTEHAKNCLIQYFKGLLQAQEQQDD